MRRRAAEEVVIHEDEPMEEDEDTVMDESRGPLEESGCTHSDDSEDEVEDSVAEDMARFEDTFGLSMARRYRLINRIGEGLRDVSARVSAC